MSTTEVWSYTPLESMEEAVEATGVLRSTVGPRSDITGQLSTALRRRWRLRYPNICTTAQVGSMLAFYDARQGGFEAFQFTNPNDAQSYTVVFGGPMPAVTATAGVWSVPEIVLEEVGSLSQELVAFAASTPGVPGFRPSTPGSAGFRVHAVP